MNPFEPSADARQAAKALFDYYKAIVDAGFSEEQGMEIIKTMLAKS